MFLQKTFFTFYVGLLMQRSLEVNPGCMPSAVPNLPLIKWKELVLVLGLGTEIAFYFKIGIEETSLTQHC